MANFVDTVGDYPSVRSLFNTFLSKNFRCDSKYHSNPEIENTQWLLPSDATAVLSYRYSLEFLGAPPPLAGLLDPLQVFCVLGTLSHTPPSSLHMGNLRN
jgi:hypothetical protein